MENSSYSSLSGTFPNVTDVTSVDVFDQNSTDNGSYSYGDQYTYYYYDDDSFFYDEDMPFILKVFRSFELTILGTVRPILVILTAITNIAVVGYFMTKRKRGNAANLLFVSIAFSDTMTGLLLLPNSFRVYAAEDDELSREWCGIYMILRLYLSPAFHTVSVWQTLILGIQRYMCVCHPFISGRFCTPGKTLLAIAVAYVFAFVLHVFHVLDDKVNEESYSCEWRQETPCTGMCVYLWFCVVLQHLLPCLALALLTARTLCGLQRATRRLSAIASCPAKKRSSRDRAITIASIAVVVVFLIPELPHGFYKLVLVIQAHGQLDFGVQNDTKTNHLILCIYEIAFLLSFHANFWIYCTMMHDFRQAVVRVATCEGLRGGDRRDRRSRGSTSSRKTSPPSVTTSPRGSLGSRHRVLSQMTSLGSNVSGATSPAAQRTPLNHRQGVTEQKSLSIDEQGNDDVFI